MYNGGCTGNAIVGNVTRLRQLSEWVTLALGRCWETPLAHFRVGKVWGMGESAGELRVALRAFTLSAELIQDDDIRWANFTLHFSKKISENDASATADEDNICEFRLKGRQHALHASLVFILPAFAAAFPGLPLNTPRPLWMTTPKGVLTFECLERHVTLLFE